MSKTRRQHHRHNEYEEQDDNYGYVKRSIHKMKQKRFDRALKTLDIDTLIDEDFDDLGDEWGD